MSFGSKNIVEVGVSMVLRDQFTSQSGKISQSFKTMMNDLSQYQRGFQMAGGDMLDMGMQVINSMYSAYKYASGVHNEIWMASKIAGASAAESNRLMNTAMEVNEITPLTAMQVASAERYLAMAGNKADAIEKMISPISKLATILGIDPGGKGGLADMFTNIMTMFQIPFSSSTDMADTLYTAVTNANISMEDLMATVRYSGADMAAANQNIEQVAAAAGVLGDMGIQASMAGTSLGNMIRYLQLSASGQKELGHKWLTQLGLSSEDFYDAQGNLISLYEIFQKFLPVYTKLDSKTRTQAFYNIFGVRGMRGIIPILEDMAAGRDKMGQILGKYSGNKGIVNRVNEEYQNTPRGIIEQWESSLENLVVVAGQAWGEFFAPFIKGATEIVQFITDMGKTWAGSFGLRLAASFTVIGMIVTGFRMMRNLVRTIVTFPAKMEAGMTAVKSTVNSTVILFKALEAQLIAINKKLELTAILMMRVQGLRFNSAGQVINASKGTYVPGFGGKKFTTPDPIDMALLMGLFGGASGGGSGTVPPAGGTVARKGILGALGALVGKAGRFVGGPWGIAIAFFLPLVVEALQSLTSSVDENTESQNRKTPDQIKKDNIEIFQKAIVQAIREGFNKTNVNVTVDGVNYGDTSNNSGEFTNFQYGF